MRPAGEIDIASVAPFRQAVLDALDAEPDRLVIDLADVTFLDSTGLSVLAAALKGQRAGDRRLCVVNPAPVVRRAIDLVGLGLLLQESA